MPQVQENVVLAPFTTLKVGGAARYFVRAENEEDIRFTVDLAREKDLEIFILGGGSNIVVSDKGFDGVVLHIGLKGINIIDDGGGQQVLIDVAAGEDWDSFVKYCVNNDLAGVECMSGIPGTVGGTPVQNVGAYGQEVSETITCVRCFDTKEGTFTELSNNECGFSYRRSIFNTTQRSRYIVSGVRFMLKMNGLPKVEYAELKKAVDEARSSNNDIAPLALVRQEVLRIRAGKSMVIDEADPNSRSAGSFFKNPIVDESLANEINGVPKYPASDGKVKISAAWLIENAGFDKGFRLGNAGISEKHSLALVNLGGAAAAEIIALKEMVQKRVFERFGVEIVPEPIFIGS